MYGSKLCLISKFSRRIIIRFTKPDVAIVKGPALKLVRINDFKPLLDVRGKWMDGER